MLRIGLTGGIGSGKSAVAARWAAHGAVVIDADRLAREAIAPGTDGEREVVAAFGAEVLTADGIVDRAGLARRVFRDPAGRRRLEGIVHPRVRSRTAELVAAASPDAIVVNDVPLLVEAGLAPSYDLVVVVTASVPRRIARLAASRAMTTADALARIQAQVADSARAAAADILVGNDGTLAELHAALDDIWVARVVPFAENLRAGRPAAPWPGPPPGSAEVSPVDWGGRMARVVARVRYRGGELVSAIVPNPPPADQSDTGVVDLQVSVPSRNLDQLAARLAAGGYPPMPPKHDHHPPEPERRHGSADPGSPALLRLQPIPDGPDRGPTRDIGPATPTPDADPGH